MNKELEVSFERLERFFESRKIYEPNNACVLECIECLNIIKQRLEQIENAKPSEALECLGKLKGMELSAMSFKDDCGTQEVDLNDIRIVGSPLNKDFRKFINIIAQALLKAQEQERKLDRVEGLTILLFSERKKIGQEYIKWCEENNAKFDDETNMATWFLSIKLTEVLCDESK